MQRGDQLDFKSTEGRERPQGVEAKTLAEERVETLRPALHATVLENAEQGGLGGNLALGIGGAFGLRSVAEEGPERLGIGEHPGFDLAHGEARGGGERRLWTKYARGSDAGLDAVEPRAPASPSASA